MLNKRDMGIIVMLGLALSYRSGRDILRSVVTCLVFVIGRKFNYHMNGNFTGKQSSESAIGENQQFFPKNLYRDVLFIQHERVERTIRKNY